MSSPNVNPNLSPDQQQPSMGDNAQAAMNQPQQPWDSGQWDSGQQQQAPPQNNAQNAGPVKSGLRHVLGQMLSNFSYGAGQSMIKASGGETDAERAMRMASMAHLNAQTQLVQQQGAAMQNKIPYSLPNGGGTVMLPVGAWEKLQQELLKNQGKTDTAKLNKRFLNVPNVGLYDTQTPDENGRPSLIPGSGAGFVITPEIADDYHLPKEAIGTRTNAAGIAQLQRGQAMQNQIVPGAGGPVAANKVTGIATPVTVNGQRVGNPGVEVAQARARAASQYGIAITDNGETISRLDALQNGIKLASGNPLIRPGLKGYEDAYTADARLKQMQQQAQDQTGASDMALLFNHISMTGGNVKGMRMGEQLTMEHMKARGIPEEIGVMYNHAISGQSLSPDQRTNFLRLANEVRNTKWQQAAQQGKAYGINPSGLEQDPDLPPVSLGNYAPKNTKGNAKPPAAAPPASGDPFARFGGQRK